MTIQQDASTLLFLLSKDAFTSFLAALLLTLVIELLVAAAFLHFSRMGMRRKVLASAAVANLLSLPVVWLIFPFLEGSYQYLNALLMAEAFAISFETLFIYFLNKDCLSLKKAFLLSAAMNVASVVAGFLILLAAIFLPFNIPVFFPPGA